MPDFRVLTNTDPCPIASVPPEKMFEWASCLHYNRVLLISAIEKYKSLNLNTAYEESILRHTDDMLMFFNMSYAEYMRWLGVSSPAVDQFVEAVAP